MADTASYPKVSANAWRTLRAKAASAPSTKFTPSGVAALLGMSSPKSAADNVVYPMRKLGLFDDEGGLTDRGNKWRVDGSYAEACDEIISDLYPAELASLTDDAGHLDKPKIVTWFQHKGLGASNAAQAAATYVMIAERSVPESVSSTTTSAKAKSAPAKAAAAKSVNATLKGSSAGVGSGAGEQVNSQPRDSNTSGPNVHLDIQIHIPATATPEQIDLIFASMAKHLYRQ